MNSCYHLHHLTYPTTRCVFHWDRVVRLNSAITQQCTRVCAAGYPIPTLYNCISCFKVITRLTVQPHTGKGAQANEVINSCASHHSHSLNSAPPPSVGGAQGGGHVLMCVHVRVHACMHACVRTMTEPGELTGDFLNMHHSRHSQGNLPLPCLSPSPFDTASQLQTPTPVHHSQSAVQHGGK